MRGLISIGILPRPVYVFGTHAHDSWEVVYYTHGSGTLTVGSEKIPFRPGTIVCQPPGVPHSERSAKGYCNVHFCLKVMGGPVNEGAPSVFSDNESSDFYKVLMLLYKEFHMAPGNRSRLVDSLLDVLHEYILSWSSGKRKNPYVEQFEDAVISNLANNNFRLDDALAAIPLSRDHFRRLFKAETGRTPLEYLTEKRISHAMQLMESGLASSITIKEIATLAGFDDPYYFSRVFRKVTGKSPSAWMRAKKLGLD
ncbi:MAG: AraC family transcriptional regulator [Clostridiales bacterium]|nr:AraC family transcriptional regulator [Clostridiales bacterium]